MWEKRAGFSERERMKGLSKGQKKKLEGESCGRGLCATKICVAYMLK